MSTHARLLLLALGMFALGIDGYVIAGLLPQIGRDLAVTDSAAGQLITVFALVYALCAPLLGILTARQPPRLVLILSLALFAAANVGTSLADSFPVLLAARVAAALAAAAFTPVAAATATALVPEGRRGRALATVASGITVATAVGVPLGTLIGGAFGWRTTFGIVAVLGAVAAAGLLLLLPPVPAPPAAGIGTRLAVARASGVPGALGLTMLWIAGAFTVLTFLSPILDTVGGIRGAALSIWLLIFGLAAVAGNALGGRAADRYPTTRLVVVSTAGLTLALAAFGALASSGAHGSAGAAIAAVALAVWGIFGWSFSPAQQHRLVELAPNAAGIVLSLNASAIYAGISLGSLLGSLALEHAGAAGVGWTATLIELLAVTTAIVLARHHRPHPKASASARPLAPDASTPFPHPAARYRGEGVSCAGARPGDCRGSADLGGL
ncbi:MFS transporter [Nocardia iowensis]|uniref:MFS transporter n=1 Tax=Nocardia iowensis TaxID=204891 RepID=A0ABX8RXK0_NOCIO|nr:MFS transporter [Nocardia iowensis]QXN94389.1 MFS transporter [Nocardia iowensis]